MEKWRGRTEKDINEGWWYETVVEDRLRLR
jgi:hypothetical protein